MTLLRVPFHILRFLAGSIAYVRSGTTPLPAYQSMRTLVTLVGRPFINAASAVVGWRRAAPLTDAHGVLGTIDSATAAALARRIERDGFVVFDVRLAPEVCDDLERLARSTPARPMPAPPGPPHLIVYDPQRPVATRYDLEETTILTSPTVQAIAVDRSIRAVAQAYLGGTPVNDLVAMWWTVAHGDEASSEAAQLFHTDRDRLRFLKFFFYLTDVTSQTGPHVYVRGSHRAPPAALRADRRFEDDEVVSAHGAHRVSEIVGERGTIIAVDTSGLHKGKHPEAGDRLLLQLEYANSLFGAPYETVPLGLLGDVATAEVLAAPRTFRRFVPG